MNSSHMASPVEGTTLMRPILTLPTSSSSRDALPLPLPTGNSTMAMSALLGGAAPTGAPSAPSSFDARSSTHLRSDVSKGRQRADGSREREKTYVEEVYSSVRFLVKGALLLVPTFLSAAVSVCLTTPTLRPLAIRFLTSGGREHQKRDRQTQNSVTAEDGYARMNSLWTGMLAV